MTCHWQYTFPTCNKKMIKTPYDHGNSLQLFWSKCESRLLIKVIQTQVWNSSKSGTNMHNIYITTINKGTKSINIQFQKKWCMQLIYDYAKDSNYSNLKDLEIPGKLALTGTRASKVLNQQLVTMELCTPCAEACSLQQSFASGWRLNHTPLSPLFTVPLLSLIYCCTTFPLLCTVLDVSPILSMHTKHPHDGYLPVTRVHHHHHREPHTYKYSIYLPEPNHLFAIALVMAVNSVAFPVIDINLLHST